MQAFGHWVQNKRHVLSWTWVPSQGWDSGSVDSYLPRDLRAELLNSVAS